MGTTTGETTGLRETVKRIVRETPVTDMHTHLFAPAFGGLNLWSLDDLLTYHYLTAETMRWSELPYEEFWSLSKRGQAEHIWRQLFTAHSPISEATGGLLLVMKELGLDTSSRNLETHRSAWDAWDVGNHVEQVLGAARVRDLVMTNDPFDDAERKVWEAGEGRKDARFHAALRTDPLLNDWPAAARKLPELGYRVSEEWSEETKAEVRRFLREWIGKMDALYLAVSMPGDFVYPADDHRSRMIDEVMVPVCREAGIPFALMIGVRRGVNPGLRLAGDMSMRSDTGAVEALCRRYPEQKFLVTMLARENQHELAVLARKFRNLMIFGCWWFLHVESMVEEMTRFRVELLGTSFIPQHSDCRVFGQLIYKWGRSREIIGRVLADSYERLAGTGWRVEEADIRRDVRDLFGNNFWRFLGRSEKALQEEEA